MARKAGAELVGFKETREALQQLSKTMQRNAGRRALRVAAGIVAQAAEARAPVSNDPRNPTPGSLKASMAIKNARAPKEIATVAVIFEDVAAVPTEYGTTKMAARPWFRPAVDATEAAMKAAFASAIGPEVEAAAERAAAKSKAVAK